MASFKSHVFKLRMGRIVLASLHAIAHVRLCHLNEFVCIELLVDFLRLI